MLGKDGWMEQIDQLKQWELIYFQSIPGVSTAKPLTVRGNCFSSMVFCVFLNCSCIGWPAIRDGCISFLQKCKKRRDEEERTRIIASRVKVLKDALTYFYKPPTSPPRGPHDPMVGDIAMLPEVRAIIELPDEAEVLPDAFASVIENLPALTARWYFECKLELGARLRHPYKMLSGGPKDSETAVWTDAELDNLGAAELVDLAGSYFECITCKAEKTFPHILSHHCGSEMQRTMFTMDDLYLRGIGSAFVELPWSTARIFGKVANISKLHRVASLLELDLKTATSKDLDDRNQWFVCTCTLCEEQPMVEVMRWRHVVSALGRV